MYYDYINSDERIKGHDLHNQAVEQAFDHSKAKKALAKYKAGLRKLKSVAKVGYKPGVYEENLAAALTDILYESCNALLYVSKEESSFDDLDMLEKIWLEDLKPQCQALDNAKNFVKNIHKKTTLFKGIVDAYNALGTAFEKISDAYLDLIEAQIDSNESTDKLQEYELKACHWIKRAIEYYEKAGSKIAKNSHTAEELQEAINIHRGFLTLLDKEFLHTNDKNSMVRAKQYIEKYNLLLIECDALEKLDILSIAVKASDVLNQPTQDLLAQINSIIVTLPEDDLQNDIVTDIRKLIKNLEPGKSADISDMDIVGSDTDEESNSEEELDSEIIVEMVNFEPEPNNDTPQYHKRGHEEVFPASDNSTSVEPPPKRSALTHSDNQDDERPVEAFRPMQTSNTEEAAPSNAGLRQSKTLHVLYSRNQSAPRAKTGTPANLFIPRRFHAQSNKARQELRREQPSTTSRDLTTSTANLSNHSSLVDCIRHDQPNLSLLLQTVAPPAESVIQPVLPTPHANENLDTHEGVVNHQEQEAITPENPPILIKPRPAKSCLKDPNNRKEVKAVGFTLFAQDKIHVYPQTSLPALAATDSENAEGYSTEDLSLMAFSNAIHSFIQEHKPQAKHEEFLGDILACIAFHFQNREKELPLLNIKLYSTAFRLSPEHRHVKEKMDELLKNKSLKGMCAGHSEYTNNPNYFMRAKAILPASMPAPASTPAPESTPAPVSVLTPARNRADRAPRSAKALARMAAPPAPVPAPSRSGMELFTSAINYMLAEIEGSDKNLVVTEIRKLVASLSTRSSFKKMTVDFCEQYYDAALETLHRTHADSAPAPRM